MVTSKQCRGRVLLAVLTVVLVLGACQAALPDENSPADDPTVRPAATLASAGAEAGGGRESPTREVQVVQTVQDRVAQVPTPLPGALVPTPARLRAEFAAARGLADASITIVEFSDYQCPYCRRYSESTYPQIVQKYVESGQVRYAFKDFPLEQLHPQARQAAEAARCAGEQDAYWGIHDRLFAAQEDWAGQADPLPIFVELGAATGLDGEALRSCIASGRHQQPVLDDLAAGQSLGVRGTPTFFVNGYTLIGAQPFEMFELAIGLATAGRLADAYAKVPTPTPMPAAEIPTAGSPELGLANAPVVMIEYSDYQCPFCARYSAETFPRLREDYVETGKVRYVFKDFPLPSHAQAGTAAQAARCAGDQGAYWGMHDLLFAGQWEWSGVAASEVFRRYAEELDLDTGAFASCLETETHAEDVAGDLREGARLGVSGTPAFFVGNRFISGAQPYEVFEQAIEAALGSQ